MLNLTRRFLVATALAPFTLAQAAHAQSASSPPSTTSAPAGTPVIVPTDSVTDTSQSSVIQVPATADCGPDPLGSDGSSIPGSGSAVAGNCQDGMATARTNQAAINRAQAASSTIQSAASRYGIDWRMLAAIGIRETNFVNVNASDGGWGVFQLTHQPGITQSQAWNLSFAANYAAKMIQSNYNYLQAHHPNLNAQQLLQATAASYNYGRGNVSGNPATIDVGTTKGNYGSNVLALMNCF